MVFQSLPPSLLLPQQFPQSLLRAAHSVQSQFQFWDSAVQTRLYIRTNITNTCLWGYSLLTESLVSSKITFSHQTLTIILYLPSIIDSLHSYVLCVTAIRMTVSWKWNWKLTWRVWYLCSIFAYPISATPTAPLSRTNSSRDLPLDNREVSDGLRPLTSSSRACINA